MYDSPEYEKMCVYCEHASQLYDNSYVLCSKHGVVIASHVCRKFIYDPMKRTVRKKPKLEKYSDLH